MQTFLCSGTMWQYTARSSPAKDRCHLMSKLSHLSPWSWPSFLVVKNSSHCETWNALTKTDSPTHCQHMKAVQPFHLNFVLFKSPPITVGYLSCSYQFAMHCNWEKRMKFFQWRFCCSDLIYLNMWSNENAASEEHFRTRAKSGILLGALSDCSLTRGFDHSFLHLFSCCLQSYSMLKCSVWFTSTKERQIHSEGGRWSDSELEFVCRTWMTLEQLLWRGCPKWLTAGPHLWLQWSGKVTFCSQVSLLQNLRWFFSQDCVV